jgi:hypothetical protein
MKDPAKLIDWLKSDHESLRQAIELLDRYLYHLRYEGKRHTQDNLLRIKQHVQFLQKDMDRRIRYEETILFPFLIMHVPRFEPLFHLLHIDHEQCRQEFQFLAASSGDISVEEVLRHGEYLTGLLRSHWSIEDKSAIASVQHELKGHEKNRLAHHWHELGGDQAKVL